MKRCTYLLTALLLWGVLTVPAGAARRSVPVQADGKAVTSAAYVEQGVTYVPLRALLTALVGQRERPGGGSLPKRQPSGGPGGKHRHRQRQDPAGPGDGGAGRDLCAPAAGV